jgi:hypothetical protein
LVDTTLVLRFKGLTAPSLFYFSPIQGLYATLHNSLETTTHSCIWAVMEGAQIRISGQTYDVIGVMEAKGSQGPQNPDEQIY